MISGILRVVATLLLVASQPVSPRAEATTPVPTEKPPVSTPGDGPHASTPADKQHGSMPADKPVDDASLYQLESKWTRADGRQVSLSSLRGKVRVLAIFYSSCEFACPVIVGRMKSLQAMLPADRRGDVGFVLVSMDPGKDDPTRLVEYAKRMELDDNWTLLKGDDGDVRELAALLGFRYREEPDGEFAHSNMISVLDREGRLVQQGVGLDADVNDAARKVVELLGP
jgi:protein SCO1/2